MSLKSRCNNKNRCALAVESLEDRRMLALTPQLVFNEVYDTTATDPVDLSVIHDVDRAYWARFTYGAVGGNQSGMQGPNLMDASILVFDQDAGETSRIYGIPNEVPTAIVELNDELVLFYDSSPTWWADWRGVEAVGQEVWKVTRAGAEPLKKDLSEWNRLFGSARASRWSTVYVS